MKFKNTRDTVSKFRNLELQLTTKKLLSMIKAIDNKTLLDKPLTNYQNINKLTEVVSHPGCVPA